jgi:hypothetical protein
MVATGPRTKVTSADEPDEIDDLMGGGKSPSAWLLQCAMVNRLLCEIVNHKALKRRVACLLLLQV